MIDPAIIVAVLLGVVGIPTAYLAGRLAKRDEDAVDHVIDGRPDCRWMPRK